MTTLDRFAREYQQYHDLSKARCRTQLRIVRTLAEHAGKPAEQCDANDVRSFLGALSEQGYHVNSVRHYLMALRPFFAWAWEVGLVSADDYLAIRRIAPPQKSSGRGTPRPYSRKELDQFWRELDETWPRCHPRMWMRYERGISKFGRIRSDAMRVQLEAIIALALHCGLRSAEIYGVTIADIHFDNEYVVVRNGKGGKEREVPHTATSRAKVQAWIEMRARLKPRHGKVWLCLYGNKKKDHLAPMGFGRFSRLASRIGSGWELHRFRHTAGTEWLRQTRRLEIVQKLLGHASVSQTLAYAELVRDDLHDAIAKAEQQFDAAVGAKVGAP